MPLIWPSQRIAAAIDDGAILTGHPPDADQVQPASLDLRLGPKAYRLPASFLPGPGRSVRERLRDLSTHEVDLTRPTVLERMHKPIEPLTDEMPQLPSHHTCRPPNREAGHL